VELIRSPGVTTDAMIGPRYFVTLLAAVGLLTGGAIGAAYVGAGPFAADQPSIAGVETEPARCASGTASLTDTSVTIRSAGDATEVTVNRTLEFPDPAHAVGNASVERTGDGEYVLSVQTVENDSVTAAQCVAVANYTTTVSVPEDSDERFTLVVREDGERIAVIENGPNGAGMSSEAAAPADAENDDRNGTGNATADPGESTD